MRVCVIGGGAAGMMAAYRAASLGNSVVIYEKNEKLGKKIYITGKGRCNVTNASDMETIFANVNKNPKFLYSALYSFDNEAVMKLLKDAGLKLKTERGNRVFPESDHSSDVIKTLEGLVRKAGASVVFNTTVEHLLFEDYESEDYKGDKKCTGVALTNGKREFFDKVILATGGLSYPTTGSTGDGYRMGEELGHSIVKPEPSLIPLVSKEEWVKSLQGLSLKNVKLTMTVGKKTVYSELGEMLFTHFGISGPLVLSASSYYVANKDKGKEINVSIDLKPALSFDELDKRVLRDFEENINRNFNNALDNLLPKKMIPVIIEKSGIDEHIKVNEISREQRQNLVSILKNLPVEISGTRPIDEAIITRGGINVKEINPSTMESKIVKDLYFAGEVIDIDAMTGGYNLQLAWSTGHLAGNVE
ncbi:MAG: NAD(P)/FAD-dependent oxidoreductase [Lachnospiraceae bacterium]|nr:NAD(P)/FAD-dependent oxidoreductase [Lachnospiraceae bacterium]